jgi:diaminopropionate ammonia-lyase
VNAERPACVVANPMAGPLPRVPRTLDEVRAFHRRLPGYHPTPLFSVPAMASSRGLGDLLLKCEATRLGLPSFKVLGASWATYRAVADRLGDEPTGWDNADELATRLKRMLPFSLAAATDGNHGRGVAHMARLIGFDARIFVPEGTTTERIEAIAGEGADVVVVPGGYDAAVARSAEEAGPRCLVISDTSWPGYTDVPRWVIEGYSTMFAEIDEALAAAGRHWPDVVVVPIGVGALAAAAAAHFKGSPESPVVIGVEPSDAACMTASIQAGRPVTLSAPQRSAMVGLNCGTPSAVAWPIVSRGVDRFVVIDDEWAYGAVRALACAGIEAGETGAAALAGLTALQRSERDTGMGTAVPEGATVLVLVTEGATDRQRWRQTLGVDVVGDDASGTG